MSVFQSCVHTHTCFCDGKDRPEVMARRAAELGFVSLGFSGHSECVYDPCGMDPQAEQEYRKAVLDLREQYGDRMEILLGIEHNYLGPAVWEGYDYVIASVHFFEADGQCCFVDWSRERTEEAIRRHFGGDGLAYAEAYYRACCEEFQQQKADIAGHLDVLTKFNETAPLIDEDHPRYRHAAFEAAACALDRGLVPELNTGAIARGYRTTPYPNVPLLRYLAERKAPIVVTSDCHDANFLDCWYDRARELLVSLGFRSTLRLRTNGWEEIPLDP